MPRMRAKNSFAAASPSVASVPESTGTTALEMAPSARIWRNPLGIRNATKNASVAIPAPKARAMMASRT